MTAAQLMAALADAGVHIAGQSVIVAPAPLAPAVKVLRTGLVALQTGRRWYGCDGSTGRIAELDLRELIPPGVTLLATERAPAWDLIRSAARLDCPHLFARSPSAIGKRPRPGHIDAT